MSTAAMKTDQIAQEKLETLLDTTFPFVGFEELRAVPIKVKKHVCVP